MNFKKRIKKLQGLMASDKLKTLLVTSPNDIFYYTGYRPSSGAFLIMNSKPKLFVSRLDNEAEKLKIDVVFIKDFKDFLKGLKGIKTAGFDECNLNAAIFSKLKKGIKLKPAAKTIKKPRAVKEPEEVAIIKKAVKITKGVLANLDILGKSESQIAKQVYLGFVKSDAAPAFDTIVASGKNSYFIHHAPGKRKVRKGDLVIVDSGAKFNNYCSDVTRTFCSKPGHREMKIIEDVKEIQTRIIDKISAGVTFKELQEYYENLMSKKGYKVFHGFGHGVGLSVHEGLPEKLKENMVLTVEPGVYIKNFGGYRIEDVVLVSRTKARIL